MAQATFVQDGCALDYTPGAAVTAGDVKVIGSRWGIAQRDISASVLGSVVAEGVFDVVSKNESFADGDQVFWDDAGDPYGGTAGTGAATKAESGVFVGYAVGAATATNGTVRVRTEQPGGQSSIRTAITDPGNAGAIPVTKSGYVAIVTAGSETRTLAAPSFIGQELLLYIKTDGGTCVVTVASAINQTGNNTITMAEVRDVIRLVAIESGSSKVWHVVSNDGAALSTV